jgi:ribonuclease E
VEEERPSAALSEPAWWQVPAAASRQPAGAAAVESSVRPAASVPRARLPAEEAAVAWDAKVQPQEAAEVLPVPSAQQPVAAEEARVVSAAEAQPREAAEAASDAEEARQPGVALAAAAEPQQAVAAAARLGAEVLRPVAAEEPAPSARQPAAERPSELPSWRLGGHPRPWLAPRQ